MICDCGCPEQAHYIKVEALVQFENESVSMGYLPPDHCVCGCTGFVLREPTREGR